MRRLSHVVLASALACGYTGMASGNTTLDLGDKAARGYALWTCAVLSRLAEKDNPTALPYFNAGYDLLKEVVLGIIEGQLTEEEARKVPVGINWSLGGGPSVDFRLGVIWADIQNYQYDETFPEISDATFDERKAIQVTMAENTFRSSNCPLLILP